MPDKRFYIWPHREGQPFDFQHLIVGISGKEPIRPYDILSYKNLQNTSNLMESLSIPLGFFTFESND